MFTFLSSFLSGGLIRLIQEGLHAFIDSKTRQKEITLEQMRMTHELEMHKITINLQNQMIRNQAIEGIDKEDFDCNIKPLEIEEKLAEKCSRWVANLSASLRPIITYIITLDAIIVLPFLDTPSGYNIFIIETCDNILGYWFISREIKKSRKT